MKKELLSALAIVPEVELGAMFTSATPETSQRIPAGTTLDFEPHIRKVYIAGAYRPMAIGISGEEAYAVSPRHLKALGYKDKKLDKVEGVTAAITGDVVSTLKTGKCKLKLEKYVEVMLDNFNTGALEAVQFPVYVVVS